MRRVPTLKRSVRRLSHAFGYDVVALRNAIGTYQSQLLTDTGIDLVVDVGANEGQYAQRMRALGYKGKILSFEPGVTAYRRLEANSGSDADWTIVRQAVGADAGEIDLYISENSVSSSTLPILPAHEAAAQNSRTVSAERVAVTTLDIAIPERTQSIWLKIDVQGAEKSVLDGAARMLESVKVIQIELSLTPLYEGQADYIGLLTRLRDEGFVLTAIEEGFTSPTTGDLLQVDGLFRRGTPT